LLRAITTGTFSPKTLSAMKRSLHALGEGVEGPLEARHVDEHELVLVVVGDAEDPPASCLRFVGDDRHLGAAKRVDEARLADVGSAGNGDEAAFHAPPGRVPSSLPLGAPHLPVP
jgi:hypothetical protein